MSGLRSKRKGKVGELEAAKAIQDTFGCHARRGVQYQGGPESPDVIADGREGNLLPLHFEVKRCERLQLRKAVAQAQQDSSDDQIPVVLHRWNGGPWLMILQLDDALDFAGILKEVKT